MNLSEKTSVDTEPLEAILASVPNPTPNDLIPILHKIQDSYGYLPRQILSRTSKQTGIALSKMYGVATFYEQFHLEPHGKHTVKCCRGTACHVKGTADIVEAIEKSLGITNGETTDDMQFSFETVACLGTCALAPVMMIDGVYYGKMTPNHAQTIIDKLKSSQEAC